VARKKMPIDPKIVEGLASIGCTMKEIAAVVGCSVDTLERRFPDLIKDGREKGKSSLRRWQWKNAEKGNTTMQIWLGKQLLGQRDFKEVPVDQDGKEVKPSTMTREDLIEIVKAARGSEKK
jgi:hypothetical protein